MSDAERISELEEMVSAAESRANQRGREIAKLRKALADCWTALPGQSSNYGVRLAYINSTVTGALNPVDE